MLVSAVFFDGNNHAFHLYMMIGQKENILLSTLPVTLLERTFPNAYATIKHSFVANPFSADRLLQELGEMILTKNELKVYFYPEYLLKKGRIRFEIAEQIIKYQEVLPMFSRTFFSKEIDPVKFYVVNQMYQLKNQHIKRVGMQITIDKFEYEYIQNECMRNEFNNIGIKDPIILELREEGRVAYALLLDSDYRLQIFVVV